MEDSPILNIKLINSPVHHLSVLTGSQSSINNPKSRGYEDSPILTLKAHKFPRELLCICVDSCAPSQAELLSAKWAETRNNFVHHHMSSLIKFKHLILITRL